MNFNKLLAIGSALIVVFVSLIVVASAADSEGKVIYGEGSNEQFVYKELGFEVTKSGKEVICLGFSGDRNYHFSVADIPDVAVDESGKSYPVVVIGDNAFTNVAGGATLEKIIIGKNVVEVGNNAFYCNTIVNHITFKGKECTLGEKSFDISNTKINGNGIIVESPGNWAQKAFTSYVTGESEALFEFTELKEEGISDLLLYALLGLFVVVDVIIIGYAVKSSY